LRERVFVLALDGRVVARVSARIRTEPGLVRALDYALSSVVAGLGFVQYFPRPDHPTIHDRLAQTTVFPEPGRQRESK